MQIFRYKNQKIRAFGAYSSFLVPFYVHFAFFLLQPRSFCSPGKVIGTWSRDDPVLNGTCYVIYPIHITQKKCELICQNRKKSKRSQKKCKFICICQKKVVPLQANLICQRRALKKRPYRHKKNKHIGIKKKRPYRH